MNFIFNNGPKEFLGKDDKLCGVVLEDGANIDADVCVLGVGQWQLVCILGIGQWQLVCILGVGQCNLFIFLVSVSSKLVTCFFSHYSSYVSRIFLIVRFSEFILCHMPLCFMMK